MPPTGAGLAPRERRRILLRAVAAMGIFACVLMVSVEIALRIGGWYADWMLVRNYPGPDGLGAFDPDVGLTRVPSQTGICVRTEFTYPVRANSLGFRDDELPERKDPEELRLWVIGDSIAAGWGVSEEDRFSERLERMLNDDRLSTGGDRRRIRVVNSALAHIGTAAEAAMFEKFFDRVSPDAVLLDFTVTNDFTDNLEFEQWKQRGGGHEDIVQTKTAGVMGFLRYHSHLYHMLRTLKRLPRALNPVGPEETNATIASLKRLKGAIDRRGVPLTVAIMGTLSTLQHLDAPYWYQADAYRITKELLSGEGFTTVDTVAIMRDDGDVEAYFHPHDTHPNSAGHARYTEILAEHDLFAPAIPVSR